MNKSFDLKYKKMKIDSYLFQHEWAASTIRGYQRPYNNNIILYRNNRNENQHNGIEIDK